ncbi:MAG: hypothetical protein ACTHJT_03720 [Cytophaga sp.]|uniref:hypothetical protein n=1 Tax=Cytophaga sp. TaxID=29535 RepID=UPI003F7EBD14
MKSLLIVIASAAILFSGLISCTPNRKMQASAPAGQIKKDTAGVSKNSTVAPEKNTTTKAAVTEAALPPASVEETFKREHMNAREASWAKQDITENSNYIVVYTEDNKRNSIIYSKGGSVVEERHQINIDQLPQNVYNSIKAKYPNYDIVSAATYKHTMKEGSYVAVVKPLANQTDMKEIELIIKEDGNFVDGQNK